MRYYLSLILILLIVLPLNAQIDLKKVTWGDKRSKPQFNIPKYVKLKNSEVRKVLGKKDDYNIWIEGKDLVGWTNKNYLSINGKNGTCSASGLNIRIIPERGSSNKDTYLFAVSKNSRLEILDSKKDKWNGWCRIRLISGKAFLNYSKIVPADPPYEKHAENTKTDQKSENEYVKLKNGEVRKITGKMKKRIFIEAGGLTGWVYLPYISKITSTTKVFLNPVYNNDWERDHFFSVPDKTVFETLEINGKWRKIRIRSNKGILEEVNYFPENIITDYKHKSVENNQKNKIFNKKDNKFMNNSDLPWSKKTDISDTDGGKSNLPWSKKSETSDKNSDEISTNGELLDESINHARNALGNTYLDDKNLDEESITLLIESSLLGTTDPDTISKSLIDEEKNYMESGDGDKLKIINIQTPKEPFQPGESIKITVKVMNNAKNGETAVFDLGISDAWGNGKSIDEKNNLRLEPGKSGKWSLFVKAPRDYHLSTWVWLDPQRFSGDELPSIPLNLNVAWDGTTMSDDEILEVLNERIHDKRYKIPQEQESMWIARFRKTPEETKGDIEREAIGFIRDIEREEIEAYWNDPARVEARLAEEKAEKESQKLKEFLELEKWAEYQGKIHNFDLAGILESLVYVDDKAIVHGSLIMARAKLLEAIKNRNINVTNRSIKKWILGSELETTDFHKNNMDTLSAGASITSSLNPGDVTVDAFSKNRLNKIMTDYGKLMTSHRNAGTSPMKFSDDLDMLEVQLKSFKNQMAMTAGSKGKNKIKTIITSVEKQIGKMKNIMKQGKTFQLRTDKLLSQKKGFKKLGKTVSNVSDLITLYDISEKTIARVNNGESETAVISEELLKWNLKKVITKNPVIATADALMSGVGQLAYICKKNKEEGNDPRQFNASSLVDMGVDGSLAILSDASYNLGRSTEEKKVLTEEDRAKLKSRLNSIEMEISKVKDPEIKKRLLTARKYVIEELEGR